MAASQATSGYSTKFQTDASGSFATIAEVISIAGPGKSAKKIDVSNMDSPGAVEEFILGLISPGEVQLTLNYLPAASTHKQINSDFDARTKRNFKIIFPDTGASVWSFSGYYTKVEPDAPVENKLTLKVTVSVTGVIISPS